MPHGRLRVAGRLYLTATALDMHHPTAGLAILSSALTFLSGASASKLKSLGCLHAVTVDDAVQAPCEDADPKRYSENVDIKATMLEMGLDPASIRFRGCVRRTFFVAEVASINGKRSYLVTYPAEYDDEILSPVTHELAHVVQMEIAGGNAALRRTVTPNLRIELGADYLAGFVFKKMGRDHSGYALSLSLIGSYYEMDYTAHGTPAQRTAAFRFGFFAKSTGKTIRKANQDFINDEYGQVIRM